MMHTIHFCGKPRGLAGLGNVNAENAERGMRNAEFGNVNAEFGNVNAGLGNASKDFACSG